MDIFKELGYEIIECDEEYNPTWEISFEYIDNNQEITNIVNNILEIHNKELTEVFNIIVDKEGEYKNEE